MEGRSLQRMTKAQLVEELTRIRQQLALFGATEQLAQIGHYEWDYESGRLISCSEEYARIFGMSVEQTMKLHDNWEKTFRLIHVDDRARYKDIVQSFPDKKLLDVEFRIVLRDGVIRHIRELGVIVSDEKGEERSSFGVIQDITDRVKHHRDMANRDVLAQQAETITDIGHFIFDLISETYVYISPGFARLHGVSCEEYLARVNSQDDDISDVHEDDYARVVEVYKQHSINGEEYSIDYRIHRADGEIRWIREQSTAHQISDGVVQQSLGVLQDITDQKYTEEKLLGAKIELETKVKYRTEELANTVEQLQLEIQERKKIAAELDFLANHDALTGLPSLRLCKDRLEHSLAESRRNKQKSAVMFVDLDGFKQVNDRHGHEKGDMVLKVVADRIREEIRETDTVARIGGDEFVVILSSVPDLEIVERIASQIIDKISQFIRVDQRDIEVSASIGIAIYPEDGDTPEILIRQADRAMYLVKESGKNRFGFTLPAQLN